MTTPLYDSFIALMEVIERHGRPAWRPQFSDQAEDRDPQASKYGGLPWLPDDVSWPLSSTGTPMSFVMQLNTATVPDGTPAAFYPNSMILLFAVDPDDRAAQEASRNAHPGEHDPSFHTMVVPLHAAGSLRPLPDDAPREASPVHVINKWEEFVDYPSSFVLAAMVEHHPELLEPLGGEETDELLLEGLTDFVGGPPLFESEITEEENQEWLDSLDDLAQEDFELKDASSFRDRAARLRNEAHGKIGGWAYTGPSGSQPAAVAASTPIYMLSWDDDPRLDNEVIFRGTGFLVAREGKDTPAFIYGW